MHEFIIDYTNAEQVSHLLEVMKKHGFVVLRAVQELQQHSREERKLLRDWRSALSEPHAYGLDKQWLSYDANRGDGFIPQSSETAVSGALPDLKTMFHLYMDGRIPEVLKENTIQCIKWRVDLAKNLLNLLEQQLPTAEKNKMSIASLTNLIEPNNCLFRAVHYPKLSAEDLQSGRMRSAQHYDLNVFTCMPVDERTAGLQIQDVTHEKWIDMASCTSPGDLIVFSAEMLSIVTNGYIRPALHKVS